MKRTWKQNVPDPIEYQPPNVPELSLLEPGAKYYRMGHCSVILGIIPESANTDYPGYHISVSHQKRYPTWDEIAHARYSLIPDDVTMVMVLPPSEDYVNLNEHTFQLHQIKLKPQWVTIVNPRGRVLGRQLK